MTDKFEELNEQAEEQEVGEEAEVIEYLEPPTASGETSDEFGVELRHCVKGIWCWYTVPIFSDASSHKIEIDIFGFRVSLLSIFLGQSWRACQLHLGRQLLCRLRFCHQQGEHGFVPLL